MERRESLNKLANALQLLLDGKSNDVRALIKSMGTAVHPDVEAVLCNVEHFLADEDLRRKDLEYKTRQEQQLVELISCLRNNASHDELLRINFL